ncbi:unnamed protein product [Fraxinus pennsylvanica]|uniref:Uncharacterized protein n=1 Tax=Fraxinus pennsylvanica TaxID=56036 RepID=A0AAD2DM85_9LAMI|nr:unnamed protein product [Fraxinus pennsylvanica]
MGVEEEGFRGWPPAPSSAPSYIQKDDHCTHFDNSVNAVSFGFVATAILISMFLVMAIFEKFLRTTSQTVTPSGVPRRHTDIESQSNIIIGLNSKLGHPSPKMSVNAREVSVLMPGDNVPTFIAQPAPVLCPMEGTPSPSPLT